MPIKNLSWQGYYDDARRNIKEIAKELIEMDRPSGASDFLDILSKLEENYKAWRLTDEEIRGDE